MTDSQGAPLQVDHEDIERENARVAAEIVAMSGSDPFAAAVRATRMPMIITNPRLPDNPVVFANESFCRLTGYARPEILGRNCRFLQGPQTDPAVTARIRAAVAAAEPLQIDVRNHRKDGRPFWNRLLLAPVRDARGEVAYFFASQVDVTTERERLEGLEDHNAALTAELASRRHAQDDVEARLRFAAEAGQMGIWELDLASGHMTASEVCKLNFGRDPAQPFSYGDLLAAVHPDDRARMRAAVDRAVSGDGEYHAEYRIVRPDGAVGWVEIRAQVIFGADQAPLRMAGISMDVTRRRDAERRLELSEESLRLATEAAEVGTWDLDVMQDALTWSDRTKAMFGISPGVACSMADFYAGLHPADRDATGRAFRSALDPIARATYDVEYRTIGKEDGVVRWVAAKGRGLFQGDRCHRAVGTAIDITTRKLADARRVFLLDLWDRLRQLTTPQAIMQAAFDALGRHLSASRVGCGYVQPGGTLAVMQPGYADGGPPLGSAVPLAWFPPEHLARQTRGQTVMCADLAGEPAAGRRLRAAGLRAYLAVPLVRDGQFRALVFVTRQAPHDWTSDEVSLVEDVAARTWDAVERARAEADLRETNGALERLVAERTAALQASEARLRTVFDSSYQMQALLDPDGTLLDTNPTSLAIAGVPREAVLGKPFWDTAWFASTPGMPALIRNLVTAAASGASSRQEISIHVPAGLRTYDLSLRPVTGPTGAVAALVPEAMDITERREAEAALRQSQKMEAVGQLTGGIAHDFNNLLAGITGSLELVQKRVAEGRTAGLERFTSAAIVSAQRAAALTQRLLAFARRQPLDPKRVEANRLVAGMDDLLRRTLGPEVVLEMVFAGGLWATLCDPNQLESAILNLAINARDAMPSGGRLTIETGNAHLDDAYARAQGGELRAGQYVCISVTDTGAGMTPEVLARAFEPFFTTKSLGQGTGLGLSMLYGFVKQSGGHVRIYSEPGSGTTFRLYLPRHRGRAEHAMADAHTPHAAGALLAEPGETVLVVDDDATVRMLVTATLEELGYTPLEAADGPAALEFLHSAAKIDLLITDVGLPGMNGRQLAEAARAARPSLQVLFITGYAHNAAIGNGSALAPGVEMITKPFALEALAVKIRSMITGT